MLWPSGTYLLTEQPPRKIQIASIYPMLLLIALLLENFTDQVVVRSNDKTYAGFDDETFQDGLILIFAITPEHITAVLADRIVEGDVVEYFG